MCFSTTGARVTATLAIFWTGFPVASLGFLGLYDIHLLLRTISHFWNHGLTVVEFLHSIRFRETA